MKKANWFQICFASVLFLLPCRVILAQQIEDSQDEVPLAVYRAAMQAAENSGKELPKLDYWGVLGAEWGMAPAEFTQSAPKLLKGAAGKMEASSLRVSETEYLGATASLSVNFDKRTNALTSVKQVYATGLQDRSARLAVYQALKARLVEVYHAPTDNINAEREFRGADAYVSGLEQQYHVEWRGKETVVSLTLSDEELAVEFRQATTSEAALKRQFAVEAKDYAGLQSHIAGKAALAESDR